MHARWVALPVALGLAAGPGGCSLALDFSNSQIPIDAAIDAPVTPPECLYLEPNDEAAAAAPITVADVGPAALCSPGDRDFYRFTVPDGGSVVTAKITFTNAMGDLDLRLYDAAGATVLAQARGFDDGEQIVCPSAAPCAQLPAGDYVLEVFGATSTVQNRYGLALSVTPAM